jgi:predicted small lipoprotein YifL
MGVHWRRVVCTGVLFGVALVAVGCGQKGPLFLPDREPTVVQQPAPPAGTEPASEETKKKEEPR